MTDSLSRHYFLARPSHVSNIRSKDSSAKRGLVQTSTELCGSCPLGRRIWLSFMPLLAQRRQPTSHLHILSQHVDAKIHCCTRRDRRHAKRCRFCDRIAYTINMAFHLCWMDIINLGNNGLQAKPLALRYDDFGEILEHFMVVGLERMFAVEKDVYSFEPVCRKKIQNS